MGANFRPGSLVLQAAGVPPNDPKNSHQAVAILQDCGFDVRYEGKAVSAERHDQVPVPVSDEFIQRLHGCLKANDSLVEAWEREYRIEKDRTER
jgi:hypothetical protein